MRSQLLKTSALAAAVAIPFALAGPSRAQSNDYPPVYGRGTIPSYERYGGYPGYLGGYYNDYADRYYNLGRRNNWYYDYYNTGAPRVLPGREPITGAGTQTVRGEVVRTKRVELQGTDTEMLAALVETPNGRRVVIDLGPVSNLRDNNVRLKSGSEIWARGRFTQVGDHRVLMARQLRADGESVSINRPRFPSRDTLRDEEGLVRRGRRNQDEDRDEGQESGRYRRGYGEEEQEQGEEGEGQRLRGRVVGTRQVQLPGLDEPLMMAVVKSERGHHYVVDLGPAQSVENLDLNKGDRVSVWGQTLRMGDYHLLVADRIRAHEETTPIHQGEEEMQPQSRRVEGHIVRTKEIRLPGIDDKFLIALVRTDGGRQYVVNLGTTERLEKVEVHKGDDVTLRGREFRVGSQRFLLADRVSANGETVHISD